MVGGAHLQVIVVVDMREAAVAEAAVGVGLVLHVILNIGVCPLGYYIFERD